MRKCLQNKVKRKGKVLKLLVVLVVGRVEAMVRVRWWGRWRWLSCGHCRR